MPLHSRGYVQSIIGIACGGNAFPPIQRTPMDAAKTNPTGVQPTDQSAMFAPCTIYPNSYPNIHYHCLPVPSAYPYTIVCNQYTINPSPYIIHLPYSLHTIYSWAEVECIGLSTRISVKL